MPRDAPFIVDVAVGAASATASTVATVAAVGRRVGARASPVVDLLLEPPLVPSRYRPRRWLGTLAGRGGEARLGMQRRMLELMDLMVPLVADVVLRRLDLNDVVSRYVDVDRIVAGVDLDAAIDLVDIDGVARRLDVDAVVNRLDFNRIVRERVDLDALVGTVDIDAAAARLDLDAVMARIDMVSLVETILAELDLPEIIRESTGSVASGTVRGVRMQGISADEAIGRAVDRLRLRRNRRPAPVIAVDAVGPVDAVDPEDAHASVPPASGTP